MTAPFRRFTIGTGALALVSALTACRGSTQTDTTTTTTGTQSSGGGLSTGTDQTVANQSAQFDVSEVAAPTELLGLIRATSLQAITARAVRLGLLPEAQATEMGLGLVRELVGDSTIAALFDATQPVDGALLWTENRPQFVVAFGVAPVGETSRRLGNRFRLNGLGNGVMELVRATARTDDPQAEDDSQDIRCFISPTPQPAHARMTCTRSSRAALEAVTPFMARTLPRRETRQDAIVATIFPATARTAFGADVLRGFDEAEASIGRPPTSNPSSALFNHPDVRTAGERFAREIVANLRTVWNESQGLDLVVSVDDNSAHLVGSADLHNPTGSLVRALTEASRTAPAWPDANLQRIPTDGGFTAGYSLNLSTFAPFARILDDLTTAIGRHAGRVTPAQLQQLQTLVSNIATASNASAIQGMTLDAQQYPIWVSVARCAEASAPTTIIQSIRAAVGLVHQPAILQVVRDFQRDPTMRLVSRSLPDLAQVRELPATGLPAGSFLLQYPETDGNFVNAPPPPPPQPNRGVRAPRTSTATPATPTRQWLFVPDGASYTTVSARDARAAWALISARTGPAVDPAALGMRQGAITANFSLATIEAIVRTGSGGPSQTTARLPDQGRTPIVLRMGTSEVDGNTRFQFSLDVQAVTLRGLMRM